MPLGPIEQITVYFPQSTPQWVIELKYVNGRRYQIKVSDSQMQDFLEWVRDMVEEDRAKVSPFLFGYTITWEESKSE